MKKFGLPNKSPEFVYKQFPESSGVYTYHNGN